MANKICFQIARLNCHSPSPTCVFLMEYSDVGLMNVNELRVAWVLVDCHILEAVSRSEPYNASAGDTPMHGFINEISERVIGVLSLGVRQRFSQGTHDLIRRLPAVQGQQ